MFVQIKLNHLNLDYSCLYGFDRILASCCSSSFVNEILYDQKLTLTSHPSKPMSGNVNRQA